MNTRLKEKRNVSKDFIGRYVDIERQHMDGSIRNSTCNKWYKDIKVEELPKYLK